MATQLRTNKPNAPTTEFPVKFFLIGFILTVVSIGSIMLPNSMFTPETAVTGANRLILGIILFTAPVILLIGTIFMIIGVRLAIRYYVNKVGKNKHFKPTHTAKYFLLAGGISWLGLPVTMMLGFGLAGANVSISEPWNTLLGYLLGYSYPVLYITALVCTVVGILLAIRNFLKKML